MSDTNNNLTIKGNLIVKTLGDGGNSSGGFEDNSFAPMNIPNKSVIASDTTLNIKWEDPSDTIGTDGSTRVKWAGTKLVYNTEHWPKNPEDGILVVDNTEWNKYKNEAISIENIDNNKTYYIQWFPYSEDGIYNTNVANQWEWNLATSFEIVTFADGTDEQIEKMLNAHYQGLINIENYWNVGDERIIHLNATSIVSGICSRAHVAQDITIIIIDFNHDELIEPINKHSKAAISIGCREMLGNNGTIEADYYWGKAYTPVLDANNYTASPLRNYLNNIFINSMPETFNSLLKVCSKKNMAKHSSNANSPIISEDKAWLPSYTEIFGTNNYEYYAGGIDYEETQYEYYKTNINKIKYPNNNSNKGSSAQTYWLRSPSSFSYSSNGFYWLGVDSDGNAYYYYATGTASYGIAPIFAI